MVADNFCDDHCRGVQDERDCYQDCRWPVQRVRPEHESVGRAQDGVATSMVAERRINRVFTNDLKSVTVKDLADYLPNGAASNDGFHNGVPYNPQRHFVVDPNRNLKLVPLVPKPAEVRITDPTTGGQKGKKSAQLGAMDPQSIMVVGEVAGFGASKYDRYNFAKGYAWSLSYDAMQRHLHAFWGGENMDPESGLPHLGHAAWHALTLLTFQLRGRGTDDRFSTALTQDRS